MEVLRERFWRSFSKEYLTSLTEYHNTKRKSETRNTVSEPMEGQIVLLKGEGFTPRHKWRLAKVVSVRRSPRDGKIRSVGVIAGETPGDGVSEILYRSPSALVPLEESE